MFTYQVNQIQAANSSKVKTLCKMLRVSQICPRLKINSSKTLTWVGMGMGTGETHLLLDLLWPGNE